MEVDPTPIQNKFSEARTLIDAENFRDALALIRSGRDAAQAALSGKLNRAIQEAAENLAHAKKFGSDSRDAEALLRQAKEQILQGEFDQAMDVVNNALERVESAKVVEKRFIDLTYKAETTIRNGRKFGIDMKAAEGKLAQAMQLRKSDFSESIKAAEEAYRVGWEATEEFAPSMKAYVDVGPVRLNEWADATLTVENIGKGLAKDVRVRILGDAETEDLAELPTVGAHRSEALRFRLKMTASGSVPLAIQIISHRVFDNKEYTQEMIAQIDVSERVQEKAKRLVADLETRCPICKGLIKTGFKATRCGCGRDFHELCATRVAAARSASAPCKAPSSDQARRPAALSTAPRSWPVAIHSRIRFASGASERSSTSGGTPERTNSYAARGPAPGRSGLRNSRPWAAARTSRATTRAAFSRDCRAFRAAAIPIGTKSSWFAEVGIESADAGWARTLFSLA